MATSKRASNQKRAQPSAPPPQKQEDVESLLDQLRHQSLTRAREALRVKVLPTLESVILMTPTGPIRNKLTSANVILLKALEELQA